MHLRSASLLAVFAVLIAAAPSAKAAVPSWQGDIAKLSSQPAERSQAAENLAKLAKSPDAENIVAALVKSLATAQGDSRYEIVRLLADFGPKGRAAIPTLVELLKNDKDNLVRAAAARSLGYLAEPASEAVPVLAETIVDKDPRVRRSAVRALVHIHPGPKIGLPLYVKALESADPGTVAAVISTAAELGEKVVPGATAALKEPKARYWGLLLLGEVGPAAKSAVTDIIPLLSDEGPAIRRQAGMTLGEIGPAAKDAVPALIKALDEKEAAVRFAAAYALGKIGDPRANAALEKEMKGNGPLFLRTVCAWALMQINPDDAMMTNEAVKLFGESLKSQDVRVRRGAARGLADLKRPPEKAAEMLIAAMNDSDPLVLESVAHALAKMGAGHVGEIAAALADKGRRDCAVRALVDLGPQCESAVPQLAAALGDSRPMFRREALFALAKIGPPAATALPQIQAELNDETPEVQYAAVYALGKIGPAAKSASPTLRKNLSSDDSFLKMATVWALLKIEGRSDRLVEMAVPMATEALNDEHEMRRVEAARSLGEIGPAAASALPRLKELAESDTPAVRGVAREAIAKINGGK
ncbi:MAG TPA: HEAT repeat domain-containing protein [Pirellulales bacterium]|nr:HEAT repeat domain-containing protein [Pirellulales bacterium]